MRAIRLGLVMVSGAALAAEPAKPASDDMIKQYAGSWAFSDVTGKKTCRLQLGAASTIGGYEVTVNDGCAKTFPVTGDIAAWRLYEGGELVFADATRKELLRFYSPDDSYISRKEVDGIVHLKPVRGK